MEAAFYGIEQKKIVKKITNIYRDFESNQPGKRMNVHKVNFLDGYEGEFFQFSPVLNYNNGSPVIEGQEICFKATQTTEKTNRPDGSPPMDKLKMCDDIKTGSEDIEEHTQMHSKPISMNGSAISMATSYAKDIVNAHYEGKDDIDLDTRVQKIIKISLDLKNHMLKNI